jgi:hypothetical protein
MIWNCPKDSSAPLFRCHSWHSSVFVPRLFREAEQVQRRQWDAPMRVVPLNFANTVPHGRNTQAPL